MTDEPDEIKIEPEVENSERREEFEDPEQSEGEEGPENKIAKIREELNACRKEKQEYMDGWQRAKADYVNALKRFETDAKASELKGKVKAVETLLPAFDALERAKEHMDQANPPAGGPEGFLAIAKQMETAFAKLGLEEIGKAGEKFNPAVHEAFAQDTADSIEKDDTVTLVLEKGWKISDFIIRPAKVKVAHFATKKKEA